MCRDATTRVTAGQQSRGLTTTPASPPGIPHELPADIPDFTGHEASWSGCWRRSPALARQPLQPRPGVLGQTTPSGPDSTTRAPTRDNATAGTPHPDHEDLEDLHDHVGCPHPRTDAKPADLPHHRPATHKGETSE